MKSTHDGKIDNIDFDNPIVYDLFRDRRLFGFSIRHVNFPVNDLFDSAVIYDSVSAEPGKNSPADLEILVSSADDFHPSKRGWFEPIYGFRTSRG